MSDSNTYPYSKYILPPYMLGASSSPGITPLKNDVKALIAYVEVLVSGNSNAQGVSPLGNAYFMDTGGKCKDSTGAEQTRYVYINNIPDGNIPFISSAMGTNMASFKGLVPGVLGDISYINPAKLFKAFDKETPCQQIIMPIRDINNALSIDEKYVCQADISEYNPCWFLNRYNPVTGQPCREGMTTRKVHSDKVVKIYEASIYLLGAYILFRMVQK